MRLSAPLTKADGAYCVILYRALMYYATKSQSSGAHFVEAEKLSLALAGTCLSKVSSLGYLGSNPIYSDAVTEQILRALGIEKTKSLDKSSDLYEAMQECEGEIWIGGYDDASYLLDRRLILLLQDGNLDELTSRMRPLLSVYDETCAYLWFLDESTNWFGYAYFERNKLLRACSGDIDHDVILNFGDLLEEETMFLTQSIFSEPSENGSAFSAATGCDLTLQLTRRFFGKPVYHFSEPFETTLFDIP